MKSGHFTPELFAFLRDLEKNNTKAWFEKNRARYEDHVRAPVLRFISDFGPKLSKISKHFVADPRPVGGSMFRIHRDTRFSKDKSPYKTNAGAQFRHEQGKDVHAPGFYLHLGADGVFAAAGIWHPDAEALNKIRRAIVAKPAAWRKLMAGPAFKGKSRFGGDKLKRPPRGFDPEHPLVDYLMHTDFYTSRDLTEKQVCAPGFIDTFASLCRDSAPFMKFLSGALGLRP